MSTLVLADPVTQTAPCHAHQHHANRALRSVLDAEIEGLTGRLRQRTANAAVACGLAPADRDRRATWLQDSLAKLQARRDALY